MDEGLALVFDMGSGEFRCGFAGDEFPRGTFRNVIGAPRYVSVVNSDMKHNYVGCYAESRRKGVLSLRYPIEHGVASDADALESVLHHALYNELRVASEEHNILLTEPPFNPRSHRQLLNQLLFETFNVPGTHFVYPAIIGSWYGGRTTSIMVDIGEGVTSIVPLEWGRLIGSGVIRTNFAGKSLTDHLARLMTERGYYLNNNVSNLESIRTIKEQVCYVPLDYNKELKNTLESTELIKTHELSDGTSVKLHNERFRCPEALFQPSLVGLEMPGIHHLIMESLSKVDITLRKALMSNICVIGGSTMLRGFADRLHQELKSLAPANMNVKIIADPARRSAPWIGGSMYASSRAFPEICIKRHEYDEYGPSIAFKKCIYL